MTTGPMPLDVRIPIIEEIAYLAYFLAQQATGVPGSQNQPAWFIDRQNVTGHASDNNTGLTALTPLRTFAEIVRRWGTTSPLLNQQTTITYLSGDTDSSDPVTATPIVNGPGGVSLTFTGTQTVAHTGTLTVTAAKNRATAQLLNVQLGTSGAPFVGMLLHNITRNGFSWIDADLGGGVVELTQMMAPTGGAIGTPNAEVNSSANGDAYEILELTPINFIHLDVVLGIANGPFTNGVILERIVGFDPQGPGSDNLDLGQSVMIVECRIDRTIASINASASSAFDDYRHNTWVQGGTFELQPTYFGGRIDIFNDTTGATYDGDVIIAPITGFGGLILKGMEACGFIYVAAGSTFRAHDTRMTPRNYGGYAVWGPGALELVANCVLFKPGASAAATLLQTGGLTLNNQNTAAAFDPATGTWHSPINLTVALLDTPIGGGGFGGTAINARTGAKITDQPFSDV